MPLETADYINELDENNPTFNDPVGRGDDQDRLIKHVLKTSFPQFTGAVTLSQTEINELPQDIVDAVEAAVTSLEPHIVPTGIISMWSGTNATIPTGWQLCNGTNGTPDLRNRFIVGSGATYTTGNNGGAITKTTSSAGTHNHGNTGGTAITVAQMPSHRHSGGQGGVSVVLGAGITSPGSTPGTAFTSFEGGGQAHTHSTSNAGAHSHTVDVRPPYYALAYIMKLSTFA